MKDIWSSVDVSFEGNVDQGIIDACFQKMDKNKDGRIEEDEFVAVISNFHRDATKKRKADFTPDRQKRTARIDVAEFFTSFINDPVLKGKLMHKIMQNRTNDSYQDTQRFIYSTPYPCKSDEVAAILGRADGIIDIHHQICSKSALMIKDGLGKWNALLARLTALTDPQERLEKNKTFSEHFSVMVKLPEFEPM